MNVKSNIYLFLIISIFFFHCDSENNRNNDELPNDNEIKIIVEYEFIEKFQVYYSLEDVYKFHVYVNDKFITETQFIIERGNWVSDITGNPNSTYLCSYCTLKHAAEVQYAYAMSGGIEPDGFIFPSEIENLKSHWTY